MTFVLGIDGGGTSCRAALATARRRDPRARQERRRQHPHRPDRRARQHRRGGAAGLCRRRPRPGADRRRRRPCSASPAAMSAPTRQQLEAILPFSRKPRRDRRADRARRRGRRPATARSPSSAPARPIMVRRDGEARAIGGWGFLVGDQGSGARIGRDLLEETLLAHDGIRPGLAADRARCSPCSATIRATSSSSPPRPSPATSAASRQWSSSMPPRAIRSPKAILARAVAAIEASLARAGPRRRRAALPARRAGAALRATPVAAASGRCCSRRAGCARRRGGHGGAPLRRHGGAPMADAAEHIFQAVRDAPQNGAPLYLQAEAERSRTRSTRGVIGPATRCPPSATSRSRPTCRASPCARPCRIWSRRHPGAAPRLGHLRRAARRARRAVAVAADLVHRGHGAARHDGALASGSTAASIRRRPTR